MSTLERKSEINVQAALELTSNVGLCLASVHCSYYSCFQLVLYTLEKTNNLDDKQRELQYKKYCNESKISGNQNILGSHDYWIREFILDCLKRSQSDTIVVERILKELRLARNYADYKTTDYSKQQTDAFYEDARRARNLIKKNYEL